MRAEEIRAWEYNWSNPPPPGLIDQVASILSREERDRADRFRFSTDRDSYVLAHGLLRLALSRRCSVDPKDWQFEPDKYGKPFIAWPPGESLRFSLTHSRGMVAVASSQRMDVGIDAEYLNRSVGWMEIAKSVFSVFEYHSLISASETERSERFFILWTLKEAYVKARGLGLSLPLDKFSFLVHASGTPEIRFEECMHDNPSDWQFQIRRFGVDYVLAIAVHSRSAEASIILESAGGWLESILG